MGGERTAGDERDTLSTMLTAYVVAAPGAPAIVDDGLMLSCAAFDDRVAHAAGALVAAGIVPGDRVALWLPNGAAYLVAIFAVARAGAAAVHVNTRFGAAEVGDLLRRTACRAIVTGEPVPGIDLSATLAQVRAAGAIGGAMIFDPATLAAHPVPAPDRAAPGGDALIYTTGGTTAVPKLVVHCQASIVAAARGAAAATGMREGDAYLAAVPLCGTFGNNGAMAAIAGGATIVTMAAFDEGRADALIRAHAVTHTLGDDRMVARLAAAAATRYDSLRWFGVAAFGADAAPAFAAGVSAGIPLAAIYGSSEVQSLFAIGDLADGVVRPVYDAARVAVIENELRLAGPSLFDRYLGDPAATEAAFADGLFRTGDRARCVEDGFVFEGRIGDTLRLGGFLVAPQEIESFLTMLPGIEEAQVVGVETSRGTKPFAFVIADAGFDEAQALRAAAQRVARYKVPVRIIALDAFPVSNGPNGPKIARATLRTMARDILDMPERRIA